MLDQRRCLAAVLTELREAGLAVLAPDELTPAEREWLERHFMADIFPVLTPMAIDPAHPFPFVPNLGFGLIMSLVRPRRRARASTALVAVPPRHSRRFVRLPGSAIRFLPSRSAPSALFSTTYFPGFEVRGRGHVPHHPGQRNRGGRRGRGPDPNLRDGAASAAGAAR